MQDARRNSDIKNFLDYRSKKDDSSVKKDFERHPSLEKFFKSSPNSHVLVQSVKKQY